MHSLAARVSPVTSIMAETIQSADEVTQVVESGRSAFPLGLDDFTQRLTVDDARVLVDLLKLSVARRDGQGKDTLSEVLTALGKASPQVCDWMVSVLT